MKQGSLFFLSHQHPHFRYVLQFEIQKLHYCTCTYHEKENCDNDSRWEGVGRRSRVLVGSGSWLGLSLVWCPFSPHHIGSWLGPSCSDSWLGLWWPSSLFSNYFPHKVMFETFLKLPQYSEKILTPFSEIINFPRELQHLRHCRKLEQ